MLDEKESMSEGRRENDFRIVKLEQKVDNLNTTVGGLCQDVDEMKVKIFNGFGESIKNTENNLNLINKENKEEHKEITKKLDKMIWSMVGFSFIIIAAEAIKFFFV